MHRRYHDILSRIAEDPSWWQQGGVPRYGAFEPDAAGIYARELALVRIACQFCRTPFVVLIENSAQERRIAKEIRSKTLAYGDPPNIGCCDEGLPSNTVTVRVIEYWARAHPEFVEENRVTDWPRYNMWRRDGALEVEIDDD